MVDCSAVATAPLLSMLCESVDPAAALTRRFGFAEAVSALGWMGDALWDTWAIAVDAYDRLVISAGNLLAWITTGDRRLIAKWSVDPRLFQRLADTATLIMWLQASGIPVAGPLPAIEGRRRVELKNVSLGVCPVIDGDLLEVGDPAEVTEAGRMLATLHGALTAYVHRIDGGRSTKREHPVHNDFRSANVLHDGTGITAVLDFEDVAYRSRSQTWSRRRFCSGLAATTGARRTSSSGNRSWRHIMTKRRWPGPNRTNWSGASPRSSGTLLGHRSCTPHAWEPSVDLNHDGSRAVAGGRSHAAWVSSLAPNGSRLRVATTRQ